MMHPYAHYYLAKARIEELRREAAHHAPARSRRSAVASSRFGGPEAGSSTPAMDVSRLPKVA